jgi:hypothetical protein
LSFTLQSALFTVFSLAAAILPQLLLRHPPPQQTRGIVAPNQPFFAFCRSCQVPPLLILQKTHFTIAEFSANGRKRHKLRPKGML